MTLLPPWLLTYGVLRMICDLKWPRVTCPCTTITHGLRKLVLVKSDLDIVYFSLRPIFHILVDKLDIVYYKSVSRFLPNYQLYRGPTVLWRDVQLFFRSRIMRNCVKPSFGEVMVAVIAHYSQVSNSRTSTIFVISEKIRPVRSYLMIFAELRIISIPNYYSVHEISTRVVSSRAFFIESRSRSSCAIAQQYSEYSKLLQRHEARRYHPSLTGRRTRLHIIFKEWN